MVLRDEHQDHLDDDLGTKEATLNPMRAGARETPFALSTYQS